MTMREDGLVAFLTARLDEDEAAVPSLHDTSRDKYDLTPSGCLCNWPARALREVEAGRELLAAHEKALSTVRERPSGYDHEGEDETGWRLALELALKLRAAVWRDHPDYRPEWKP